MNRPADTVAPATASRRWLVLIAAFLGWMFDGLEMGIFPLIARPALIEMHPHLAGAELEKLVGLWNGRFNAGFLLGAAAGGLVFGWLGDRIGRVRAMAVSILTYSLFTGVAYFAQQPWHLMALRFVAALGMGGEWALGVALVMEVWPEKLRPILAGVIGAAANVGLVLIALVAIWFPVRPESWRWLLLVGVLPALLTFFIRLFVPESERWKHAAAAGPARPLHEIFSRALLPRTVLAIAFASIALIATWGAVQWMALWADKLAGAEMPRAKAWTQVLAAFGAIVGCLLGAWLGGRLGRRPAYFLLCLSSLAAGSYLFRGVSAFGTTFLVMAFVVGVCTASFYGWLPLYLPELFPTRVRATGQGLSFNFGRIFAAAGALQMGALMQTFHGDYARAGATIVLIYVLGLVLIWLAPETRGKPLPD
jgi:SHS family sialic acid transporter-like MFS transporter